MQFAILSAEYAHPQFLTVAIWAQVIYVFNNLSLLPFEHILIVLMSKRHKASDCISSRRISDRALATVLEHIRDTGLPEALSRSTIHREKTRPLYSDNHGLFHIVNKTLQTQTNRA